MPEVEMIHVMSVKVIFVKDDTDDETNINSTKVQNHGALCASYCIICVKVYAHVRIVP